MCAADGSATTCDESHPTGSCEPTGGHNEDGCAGGGATPLGLALAGLSMIVARRRRA
ncbi:MAG: hypothetical protein U1F43_16550 [Myxococcota bacterium]